MDILPRIERLEEKVKQNEIRVEKNTQNIERMDKSVSKMEVQFDLIMKSLDEVKVDLKALTEARFDDHYRKPIENWDKLKWAVITMVTTTGVSAILAFISSGIL